MPDPWMHELNANWSLAHRQDRACTSILDVRYSACVTRHHATTHADIRGEACRECHVPEA